MDEDAGSSMSENGNSKIWWIVGAVVVLLVIGYLGFKWMGGDDSTLTDADATTLSESDTANIPQTGEELIDDSVIDDTSDVNLGEDLI